MVTTEPCRVCKLGMATALPVSDRLERMCFTLKMTKVFSLVAFIAMSSVLLVSCTRPSVQVRLDSVKPSLDQLKNGDYEVVNSDSPGSEVSLGGHAKYGKYTVFDFSSPY